MVQLWRLTRNRYGRAVYDALHRVGITATTMIEYARELDMLPNERSPADGIEIQRCDPTAVEVVDAPTHELLDGEDVIAAFEDGEPLGYLFLSVGATLSIHPLERVLSFDDGYVRRVYVASDHRQRGIASALVAAACHRASKRGAGEIRSLVAADNVPSRRLFESLGFETIQQRWYARVGPVTYRT